MCECIKNVKHKIRHEIPLKNNSYSDLKIEKVDCDNEAFIFTDSGMITGLGIPFTAHHQQIRRKTKTTINMIATYCPFCGEKYAKEDKQ